MSIKILVTVFGELAQTNPKIHMERGKPKDNQAIQNISKVIKTSFYIILTKLAQGQIDQRSRTEFRKRIINIGYKIMVLPHTIQKS